MESQTSNRNVQPNDYIGGWEIVRAGSARALAFDRTREGAVRKARAMVRREGGGEVRVKNRVGKVVESKRIRGRLRLASFRPAG